MDQSQQQPSQVSELLIAWTEGDNQAFDQLIPLVYDELRERARRYLRRERRDHTLQTTALVHEAYLRLAAQRGTELKHRRQFFWIASIVMRRILVDHARRRAAEKRGGDEYSLLDMEARLSMAVDSVEVDLVSLDDALNDLANLDEQQAKIVELRYFAGLNIEDTAETLGISPSTVKRDWKMAKAWLRLKLK